MSKLLLFDEKLKVEQVVAENRVQKIVKGVLEIPEQKPDISQILDVTATPQVESKQIIDMKKVLVEGELDIKVLYAAEVLEGNEQAYPVHSFHGEIPFSDAVHLDRMMKHHVHHEHMHHGHDLKAFVEVEVEDVFSRIIDSRTVEVEVVLEIFVKLVEFVQIRVITDIKGIGVLTDRRRLKVESVVNEGNTQKAVRRAFDLAEEIPDVESIVDVEADVVITSERVIEDKVLFEGEVIFHVLYVADTLEDDQPVHNVTLRAPFTHFIELPGAVEGMNVTIMPEIEDVLWKIKNSRALRLEAVIDFFVKVTETKQIWVVTNAFNEEDIVLEKMLVKVQEVIGEDTKQITEEFTVSLANENNITAEGPDIAKIISVDAKVKIEDYEIIDDKVIVEGLIKLDILYVAETVEGDQPVFFTKQVQPFTMFIDIPGAEPNDMQALIRAMVEDISWRLVDSFTIDFNVVLEVFVKVTEPVQLEIVIDAVVEDC